MHFPFLSLIFEYFPYDYVLNAVAYDLGKKINEYTSYLFMHYNQLQGLWDPKVQCRIHKGSPILPTLSRINLIPRTDTYFIKVHSDMVHPSTIWPP